jgi:membrane protease YdiL (CAAX protease family)
VYGLMAAAMLFVALAVLIACAWSWLLTAAKAALTWQWIREPLATRLENTLQANSLSPRLPLVAWSPRRPAPWAFFDLLAVIGISVVLSLALGALLLKLGWVHKVPDDAGLSLQERQVGTIVGIVVRLLVVTIGLWLIALRTGATLQDFGWSRRDTWPDLRLGLIGFVMVGPLVFAVQGLLVRYWQESSHPLIEQFRGTPDPLFFVIVFVSAVIVAPIFEELVFRVLLQGFLEKAFSFRGERHELFFGATRLSGAIRQTPPETDVASVEQIAGLTAPSPEPPAPSPHLPQSELHGQPAWLPIIVSSLIFALLHYSHGPDWVPLILLATGMGYLYQRTHRLLPSLVVHAAVNAFSMWGLWVQVMDSATVVK